MNWLVHNGRYIQKQLEVMNWLETWWSGRLYLVTKVLQNFIWTYHIQTRIKCFKLCHAKEWLICTYIAMPLFYVYDIYFGVISIIKFARSFMKSLYVEVIFSSIYWKFISVVVYGYFSSVRKLLWWELLLGDLV